MLTYDRTLQIPILCLVNQPLNLFVLTEHCDKTHVEHTVVALLSVCRPLRLTGLCPSQRALPPTTGLSGEQADLGGNLLATRVPPTQCLLVLARGGSANR